MSDEMVQHRLPSQEVVTVLLDEFKNFLLTGQTEYFTVAMIDGVRYVIGCEFDHEKHTNNMWVYAWHKEGHPEVALSLMMKEWET